MVAGWVARYVYEQQRIFSKTGTVCLSLYLFFIFLFRLVIMKFRRFFENVQVDEFSATPKYLQLTHSILDAIEAGKLKKDDLVPSINELSFELEISRDTAEKDISISKKWACWDLFREKAIIS